MDQLITAAASNSLVGGVVAFAIIVMGRRIRHPGILHGLWLILLLKLVTPPLVAVPLSWFPPSSNVASTMAADGDGAPLLTYEETAPTSEILIVDDAALQTRSSYTSWSSMCVLASLLGTVIYYVCCFYRAHSFSRWLRYASPAPADLVDRSRRFADRMGLCDCPEIRVLPGRLPPLVWSVWGVPRIFLPKQLLERLAKSACDALLVHELAHVRRYDHWVRYFEIFVTGLYWWNPLVWLARRKIREAEELCCDQQVLKYCSDCGPMYARSLLETLDFLSGEQVSLPAVSSALSPRVFLKRRIEMLLHGSQASERRWTRRFTLLVALSIVLPIAFSLAGEPAEPPSNPAIGPPESTIKPDAILVHVRVLEVSLNKLRKRGMTIGESGLGALLDNKSKVTSGVQKYLLGVVDTNSRFLQTIQSLQDAGFVEILAEPTLVTRAGRPASFSSGRKVPVLLPQGIEYRQFGTRVDLVSTHLGNGTLRLNVKPVISGIDHDRTVTVGDVTVPGLYARTVDAATELNAGQTMAITGVTRAPNSRSVERVPEETELIVLATPEFVSSLQPATAAHSADNGPREASEIGPYQRPALPNRIYRAGAAMPDGRWIAMSTESKSIKQSWQIEALNPVIKIAGRKVVVQSECIVVDGEEVASIRPDTRRIELAERNGKVSIVADGKSIHRF